MSLYMPSWCTPGPSGLKKPQLVRKRLPGAAGAEDCLLDREKIRIAKGSSVPDLKGWGVGFPQCQGLTKDPEFRPPFLDPNLRLRPRNLGQLPPSRRGISQVTWTGGEAEMAGVCLPYKGQGTGSDPSLAAPGKPGLHSPTLGFTASSSCRGGGGRHPSAPSPYSAARLSHRGRALREEGSWAGQNSPSSRRL